MVDQFEAEKCLYAASTDNLVLTIIDNRSDPWAVLRQPPGNSDGTNTGTRAERSAKLRELPGGGGCWHLELTDALHH